MKMQVSFRQAIVVVVGTALSVAGLSCKLGPVNYDKFERRTIEENLAAIDSASSIYAVQFAAGNIDAACSQAQAFLLTQSGVERVGISPDSIVWAHFTSGLLAGTGDVRRDTAGSAGAVMRRKPDLRTATGGETGSPLHCVLPHNVELPGTQLASDVIRDYFQRRFRWGEDEAFTGSEVDLGVVEGLINPGTGVLFWSGHGTLVDTDTEGVAFTCGLVLGKSYTKQSLADAAVRQFAGYFNPSSGQQRQAAVVQFAGAPDFNVVVLPGFIRAHGNFDNAESLPFNSSKTIVYLSCCYSLTTLGGPGSLYQAFRDAGADLVCGYSWSVGDAWSCDKDTRFFEALSDTCFPREAMAKMGGRTDPNPGRSGIQAEFLMGGDTLVLLQTVLQAKKDGTLYRSGAGARAEMYGSEVTKVYDWVRQDGSSDEAALVTVLFPSTSPGSFDLFTSGAYISWADIATGRTYWAQNGYVGTGGTLTIDHCTDSLVVGHFSATLGWWDAGKSPYADPPSDAFTLEDGILKYSGKITHLGTEAALPGSVSAQLPAGF
jgi:hypothetical protein